MQPIDPNAQPPYDPPTQPQAQPQPYYPAPGLVVPAPPPDLPRFPSRAEIAGAIALAVPFAVSVSSGSVETENGRVVSWSYSNPIEIIGGLVAIVCALFAFGAIRRSAGGRRAQHALAVLALAGLGVVRILHGSGQIGGPTIAAAAPAHRDDDLLARPLAAAQAAHAAPALDPEIEAAAHKVLDRWRTGDFEGIWRDSSSNLQAILPPGRLRREAELLHGLAGAVVGLDGPITAEPPDGEAVATALVRYERGTIPFTLHLVRDVHGEVVLDGWQVHVPDTLQRRADAADAERNAARIAAAFVSAPWDTLRPDVDSVTLGKIPADFDAKLAGVRAKIGVVRSITQTVHHACDENECFTFQIAGTTNAKLELTLTFEISRWQVLDFEITPE